MKSRRRGRGVFGTFLAFSLPVFIGLFAVLTLVLYALDDQFAQAQLQAQRTNAQHLTSTIASFMGTELDRSVDDALFLKSGIKTWLTAGNPIDEVAREWSDFRKQSGIYDFIEFLDTGGNRLLRVDESGSTITLPEPARLPDGEDRDCVQQALQLPRGSVYVAPIEPTASASGIAAKPLIRICALVYGPDGRAAGVLLLGHNAQAMLQRFRQAATLSEGPLYLLNQDGYWLVGDAPGDAWGFVSSAGTGATFQERFPNEWSRLIAGESGLVTTNGLFSVSSIPIGADPSTFSTQVSGAMLRAAERQWFVVDVIPANSAAGLAFQRGPGAFLQRAREQWLLRLLLSATVALVVGIGVAYRQQLLHSMQHVAEHDALTGIYNRKAGLDRLVALYPSDNRRRHAVAVCFMDVNGLKEVNDSLGHKQGDQLLKEFVQAVQSGIRDEDFIFRVGGDEFAVALPDADREHAEMIWMRIKAKLEQASSAAARRYSISASHGIVSSEDGLDGQVEQILALADQRMYEEKRAIKPGLQIIRDA